MKLSYFCWFTAFLALASTIAAIIIISHISNNIEEFKMSATRESYDIALIIIILSGWFMYVLSAFCFVRNKYQPHWMNGIGLLGPLGLLIAILSMDRRKYRGLVKVEIDDEVRGFLRVLPKQLRGKRYKWVHPEELEKQQDQETIEADIIEVKTLDGRILKLRGSNNTVIEEPSDKAEEKDKPREDSEDEPDTFIRDTDLSDNRFLDQDEEQDEDQDEEQEDNKGDSAKDNNKNEERK
jgi:hypothetical protein